MTKQNKKRILIICNELSPYLEITDFSKVLNQLAVKSFDAGYEVRVIMPRFGTINERRHRLHEVVRLSGINVPVDKEDYPLLIKVASLPNARLQVYFMDNEDFFKRKLVFRNDKEEFFEDNAERAIFFCKSALEIVKKFGWPPDIIHCHGWMTSLIPTLIKTSYKKEPVFAHSQVLYTAQSRQFEENLGADFVAKVANSTPTKEKDLTLYNSADHDALVMGAAASSDFVIFGDDGVSEAVKEKFPPMEGTNYIPYDESWNEDAAQLFQIYENLLEEVEL